MQIGITTRGHFTCTKMIKIKKTACVRQDVEKSKPSCPSDGNTKWWQLFGIQTGWWLLTRLKPRVANDPAIPVLGKDPENRTCVHTKTCYRNVHGHMTRNSEKVETTQMLNNQRVATSTVVYPSSGMSSSHERNEALIQATTGMELKNMTLRGSSPSRFHVLLRFHLHECPEWAHHRDRKWISVCLGLGSERDGS